MAREQSSTKMDLNCIQVCGRKVRKKAKVAYTILLAKSNTREKYKMARDVA